MKKIILYFVGFIFILLLIIAGILYSFTTDKIQKWILGQGIEILKEKLQTNIEIDSVGVNFLEGEVALYGFRVDDRKNVRMLNVDTLEAKVNIYKLLDREVEIDCINLSSTSANLYKEKKDSAANYQFVIDVINAEKAKAKAKKKDNPEEHKTPLQFNLKKADVTRISVNWNSNKFGIDSISFVEKDNMISLRQITIKTDNGKPRKNFNKPNRGAFDAGHLDFAIDLDVKLNTLKKDTIDADIIKLSALDKGSGLLIRSLTANVRSIGKDVTVGNLIIGLGKKTTVNLGDVHFTYDVIPGNKEKKIKSKVKMNIDDTNVTADVHLQDINQPFVPAFSNFTTPLDLKVTVGGTLDCIRFSNVIVTTKDKRLKITTDGELLNAADKKLLRVNFRGIKLSARNGIKEQIINHFAKKVRLKMMPQLKAVGDIRFNGLLNVRTKHEHIQGKLITRHGNVNVSFDIDNNKNYLYGTMNTPGIDIGAIMDVKYLGPVCASASYNFDIDKKRNAKLAKKHKGRLPFGWLKANIKDARYGIIHFKEIHAELSSNGKTASGVITIPYKLLDVITTFEYTQTEKGKQLKVKPGLKRHRKEK